MSDQLLQRLQAWYARHLDGNWEHYGGLTIGNLDNPGWRLDAHLEGTELESAEFDQRRVQREEYDWIHCWKEGSTFKARCGPLNLEEALSTFLDWDEQTTGKMSS